MEAENASPLSLWSVEPSLEEQTILESAPSAARGIAQACAGWTCAVSGVTLVAYWLEAIPQPKLISEAWLMRQTSAVAFFLLGLALLQLITQTAKWKKWLGRFLTVSAIALAAASLAEQFAGAPLATYTWFINTPGLNGSIRLYTAPITALNLLLLGFSLLALDWELRNGKRPAQYVLLLAGLISLQGLIAYGRGMGSEQIAESASFFSLMSLSSTLATLGLVLGTLCSRPSAGIMKFVFSDSYSSKIVRYHLLSAVVLPPALVWLLSIQMTTGIGYPGFVDTLFAVILVGALASLTWRWGKSLHRYEQHLRKSYHYFRTAIESAPSAAIILDKKGTIRFVNMQVQALFGYESSELIGRPIEVLIPPRYRPQYEFFFSQYLARPQAQPVGVIGKGMEMFGLRKDGGEVPVDFGLTPLFTEEGVYIISAVIDLTDRRKIERAMLEKTRELEQSNHDLQEFASIASHDLKEPLRMVSMYLGLIDDACASKLSTEEKEYLHYALDGALRMNKLIEALLQYSRVGQRNADHSVVDMDHVIDLALLNLKPSLDETNPRIEKSSLPRVVGEEYQLVQLFQNLISNAVKFRKDTEPVVIKVGAESDGEGTKFHVTDNGIGFEPRHAERIFKLFQRLGRDSRYPGTGIGLAVCKRIVEQHGGKIWADPKPGQGTSFYFTLPTPA